MPLLDVGGVRINFPFEPYDCQVDYMTKVVECLQKSVNGALESPTGTGKTLCLLCASLAWQEARKAQTEFNKHTSVSALVGSEGTVGDVAGLAKSLQNATGTSWGGSDFAVPKIIYASRTHSQLSQVVQELKRTAYNSVKVSVIGSRDQLCIHEGVKKEQSNTNKVHMCRAKVSARTCHFYNRLDALKNNSEPRVMMGNVVDIEDLVAYGQKNKVCPYYMARELKGDADIIFMPYNYLLDLKTRKAHGVELQGNVVIFDEAHNLEKICEESSSFDLKPGDLATAIEELTTLGQKFVDMFHSEQQTEDTDESYAPDFNLDDILRMKSVLQDLENEIDAVKMPNTNNGLSKPGMFMFELLGKANIGFDNKNTILDILEKMVDYIASDASGAGVAITKGAGLSKMADIFKIIFSQEVPMGQSLVDHQERMARSYKVHFQKDDPKKTKKQLDLWTNTGSADKMGITMSYWCFSPGHSMKDLVAHGIKSVILTSGTLSPLTSFTSEMQIPFPVSIENPHVIQKHQVWVGALKKGPDGTVLNSNYETRFTPAYQGTLGNLIVNFARVVPNGLLIFYPSYPVMESCLGYWKDQGIWSRIEQYKQIFVESRAKGVLNDMMNDFYSKINDPSLNGAIFMAVCRGKVSEGLDFADMNGRAVVITGLPYPPYMDPKVVLKMAYLDQMKGKQGFQSLAGKEWYRQQASRAVNQAIGRVIRHKDDFGAIILCDTRFTSATAVNQLPVWVRSGVTKYEAFGQVIKDLSAFFKTAEKLMPAPGPAKPRIKSSSGASFVPTSTHRQTDPAQIQPSNAVTQHVTSLKHRNEVMSADELRDHYAGSRDPNKYTSSQKSLFSALDEPSYGQLSDTQIPSYQASSANNVKKEYFHNRRRIIIKKPPSITGDRPNSAQSSDIPEQVPAGAPQGPPGAPQVPPGAPQVPAGTPQVPPGAPQGPPGTPQVPRKVPDSVKDYIAEVKTAVSAEHYKLFSKALYDYRKCGKFDPMFEVLVQLFTENKEHHHLIQRFYKFVRPEQKQQFKDLVLQLTGVSVGHKSKQCVVNKSKECVELKECVVHKHKESVGHKRTQDTENVCIKKQKTADRDDRDDGFKEKKKANSDDFILTCEDVEECRRKFGDRSCVQDVHSEDEYTNSTCYVCKESDRDDKVVLFWSLCRHVCCIKCWRKVFEGDKLCPECRKRVRRRQLTRV